MALEVIVKRFILIFLLFMPSVSYALSGSEACSVVESTLPRQGIYVSCQYIQYDASLNHWMYAVVLGSTPHDGYKTLAFIAASILGIDPQVPNKTGGVGVTRNGVTILFMMEDLRVCQRVVDNDYAFINCVSNAGTVGE